MKVAHIIFSLNTGGAETMLVDIMNEQVKHATLSLFIINGKINKSLLGELNSDILIYELDRVESSKNPWPIIRLNYLLLKSRIDAVHIHNHNAVNVLLPVFRKKSFLTVHTTDVPTVNFNRYNKIFAISKAVKKDIALRWKGRVKVIYNGINHDKIVQKKQSVNSKEAFFKLVQVSRLDHEKKGQHLAIKAFKKLFDDGYCNLTLDFIGSGESIDYLKKMIVDNGLEDRINFLGLKGREFIYDALHDYDLLIQPSMFEGFGLTIVEAQAAMIPVLVADIEGPMEIIDDGKYGFFFERGSVDSLVSKIINIMNTDYLDVRLLTENALKYSTANFNVKVTANRYLNDYKNEE